MKMQRSDREVMQKSLSFNSERLVHTTNKHDHA